MSFEAKSEGGLELTVDNLANIFQIVLGFEVGRAAQVLSVFKGRSCMMVNSFIQSKSGQSFGNSLKQIQPKLARISADTLNDTEIFKLRSLGFAIAVMNNGENKGENQIGLPRLTQIMSAILKKLGVMFAFNDKLKLADLFSMVKKFKEPGSAVMPISRFLSSLLLESGGGLSPQESVQFQVIMGVYGDASAARSAHAFAVPAPECKHEEYDEVVDSVP